MMMAKPRTDEEKKNESFANSIAQQRKPQSAEEAVEDLERRLALLSEPGLDLSPAAPVAVASQNGDEQVASLLDFTTPAPAQTQAPIQVPTQTPQYGTQQGKGGKNALLARIMAAQEKAKMAGQPKENPSPQIVNKEENVPPPIFDPLSLPPPTHEEPPPPPAFDLVENSIMNQVRTTDQHVSRASSVPPPVMPSAPSLEDLLDTQPLQSYGPPNSTSHEGMSSAYSAEEEMILGLEGLSMEEKRSLLDEQRKIMEQIEQEKTANEAAIAAAQADAFDSRSMSLAVRSAGGQGRSMATRVQIPTSAEVENYQDDTVSADQRLAEQLQKEEYERVNQEEQRRARQEERRQQQQQQQGSSWWDTVSNMFTVKTDGEVGNPTPQSRSQRDQPGVTAGMGRGGLAPVQTGQEDETVDFTRSYNESGGLLGSTSGMQAARVAERQPLFSCVVDSVSNAATSFGSAITSQTIQEDPEGNVHGVDASSLLAVPQVSRGASEYRRMPQDS